MKQVVAEGICKSYGGREVLREVSFVAAQTRATCLMAPSGAGKTTLVRILMGLEAPDRGRVRLMEGWRWSAVFQEDRLLERRSAEENLRFVLGADWDREKSAAVLEALGLERRETPVAAFSGGMRRRVALARALLAPSDALVLDEPFAGLDPESRARSLEAVRRLSAGRVVILVSHDASDAAALDAQILRL